MAGRSLTSKGVHQDARCLRKRCRSPGRYPHTQSCSSGLCGCVKSSPTSMFSKQPATLQIATASNVGSLCWMGLRKLHFLTLAVGLKSSFCQKHNNTMIFEKSAVSARLATLKCLVDRSTIMFCFWDGRVVSLRSEVSALYCKAHSKTAIPLVSPGKEFSWHERFRFARREG